jgi:hypothetical protein
MAKNMTNKNDNVIKSINKKQKNQKIIKIQKIKNQLINCDDRDKINCEAEHDR